MNSLTELIIFAVIMGLVSLLGKRKKKPQDRRTPGASYPGNASRSSQKDTSTQEMLEEILGFKLPKQTQPLPQQQRQDRPQAKPQTVILDPPEQSQTTWNPAEEYSDTIEINTVRADSQRKKEYDKAIEMDKLKRAAEKAKRTSEKIKDVKLEALNAELERKKRIAGRIKRTIHNPERLQEYLIISEILSKPKALRR